MSKVIEKRIFAKMTLATLLCLQFLDLHSSLTANGKFETNQIATFVASHSNQVAGIIVIKLISFVTIFFLFTLWKANPKFEKQFVACFLSLDLIYGAIVFNNYL